MWGVAQQMDINPLALYFLFVYCLLLPFLAVRGYHKLRRETPPEIPPKKLYLRTILGLIILTLLPLLVIYQIDELDIFVEWHPGVVEVGLGVFLLFGWFCLREFLAPWLKKAAPKNAPVRMPLTWRQLALWACVSITAGVCEEIIYRGVLFDSLWWFLHQPLLAAAISAAAFGVAHINQGPRSAFFIGLLALTLQGLVWIAGNLYLAMLIHATYDFAVGLRYVIMQKRAAAPGVPSH